jgi:hypothetical protein
MGGPGSRRAGSTCTVIVFLAALATPVAAQDPFPADEFNGMTFHPTVGSDDYLMVEGATVGGLGLPLVVGAWFDYAHSPVDIITQCADRPELECAIVGERAELSRQITAFHLTGAYTLGDRLQLGLSIPIAYASGEGLPFVTGGSVSNAIVGGSKTGIADPRVRVRAQLFGSRANGFAAAVSAFATVPLGQATADGRYLGDDGPGAGGSAIVEAWLADMRFAVNLGGFYRPVRGVIATEVGPMLSYGGALEYWIEDTRTVSVLGELTGATGFDPEGRTDQVEGRLGGRLDFGPVTASLGLGAGLVYGPGVPTFRILLGARYAERPRLDTDRDGIFDDMDACPDVEEDEDGYVDDDGCPEEDNDGDGLVDGEDQCPNDAEDSDDHEDEDGCPDDDNDGDGVRDGYDSCPETPEDMDGDRDTDGCPDADTDGDHIDDRNDECPNEPEDTDGFADGDGCPEVDVDEDGVPDEDDECPEDPEDDDDFQDRDGCPEEGGSIRARPRPPPSPSVDEDAD